MKYCEQCGKELLDEAVACPDCGTKTDGAAIPKVEKAPTSKNKKIPKFVFIIGAIIVVLGIVAAILFHRPNLRIDDLKMHTNPVSTILQFGIPDGIEESGNLRWEDCGIEFYGKPVRYIFWNPNDYSIQIWVYEEDTHYFESKMYDICDDYSKDFTFGISKGNYKEMSLSLWADILTIEFK